MSISVRKLSSRIGAVVEGVDLTGPRDAATVAAVRSALNEHKALVFDSTGLDDAGQQRVASWFGPLTAAHPTVPAEPGVPQVLPVDSEAGRANQWHTDVTFVLNPPQVSTLRSIVIPPYGGETLIANAAAAYRDLPEALRTFAEGLWAVHTNDYDYVRARADDYASAKEREYYEQFVSTKFETAHPVVRIHPLTGERGLFIGGFAQRIVGLSHTESRDILRLLQAHVTRPENVLRWAWAPEQLVIFDNRITQHYAIDNYDDQPRRLNRVTVAGDIPVGVDGRRSESLVGDASHYTPVIDLDAAA
jgi:taurine dioxygenase